jgi:hypothetical protein
MRTSLVVLLVLALCEVAGAQTPKAPDPSEQISKMKALDYLAGEWKGSGWIQQGGPRQTFSGGEIVQRKLNGVALLVEGRFTSPVPGENREIVSHETLGVISYDPQTAKYTFRAYLANGLSGEYELFVLDKGWRWGFQVPAGEVRYTMAPDGLDRWVEVGEIFTQGAWRKFFEMTLERSAR